MSNARVVPNRAAQVRERQIQRTQSRVEQTVKNINPNPKRPSPTIHTRGQISGMVYPTLPVKKTRRQFYYTLGQTGSEIRFPAVPQVQIGWRFLSFILFSICFLGIYFLFSAPLFQVQQIETEGLIRLTAADLNSVLDISGRSIAWIDASVAQTELAAAFPELKDLQITVSLPNSLIISVHERQPVIAWSMDDHTYWIDNEGILIPPRGEATDLLTINASVMPPLVKANDNSQRTEKNIQSKAPSQAGFSVAQIQGWGDQINTEIVDAAFRLSLEMPVGTIILYNQTHGLGWKSEGGWDVYVGLTLSDIEYKLIAYNSLINKLDEEGITPSMVSIEHLHAPYYRE